MSERKTPEEICADLEKISPLALPEYLYKCYIHDKDNAFEVLDKAVEEFGGKGGVANSLLDTTLKAVVNSSFLCLLRKFNEDAYKKVIKTKATDFSQYVKKAFTFELSDYGLDGQVPSVPYVADALQQDMLRRNMVRQPGEPVDGKFNPQFDAKNYTGRRNTDWKGGVRSSDFPKESSPDGRTVRGVGGETLFIHKEDTGGDRSKMAEGDHVTPLETIHGMSGYFAERYVDLDKTVEYRGADGKVHKLTVMQAIANDDSNFQILSGDKNAAKGGGMTNAAFIKECEKIEEAAGLYKEMESASPERKKELQAKINKMNLSSTKRKAARMMSNEEKLSPEEKKKLKRYKLTTKEKEQLLENQKKSEAAIRNKLLVEGGKTVLMEQIGKIVEVLIGPIAFELRDSIKNGITNGFDGCDAFEAFCKRVWRALKYAFSKLGEILKGLLGDLAKMVATLFANMCKMLKDFFGKFFDLALSGISVLVESVKVLMGAGTMAQKGDAILKIIVGFVTGILGQTLIDSVLESIGLPDPFSDIVASICSAVLSTLVMSLFDKLDLFGMKRELLRRRIDEIFDARAKKIKEESERIDMVAMQVLKRNRVALERMRTSLDKGLVNGDFDIINQTIDNVCQFLDIELPYSTPQEFLLYLRDNEEIIIR